MPEIPYLYLRALELEGRHSADDGAWEITAKRLGVGEGYPDLDGPAWNVDFSPEAPLPPTTKLARYQLWPPFAHYRRIRSSTECVRYLETVVPGIPVSLELTAGWASAPGGVIPMPPRGEGPLPMTHIVCIDNWSHEYEKFRFANSWGTGWGDDGRGYLGADYFDKYVFECLAHYPRPTYQKFKKRDKGDRREIDWLTLDEWRHRVYGFEVRDERGTDRLAWAYVVERDGALEVEELYVRPEFRGRGYGRSLTDRIAGLIRAKKSPARLWVPFADSLSEAPGNRDALLAVVRRLGMTFRSCPVRWAAYLATDCPDGERSEFPIEPPRIPARPRSPLEAVMAAALAIGTAAGNGAAAPIPAQAAATDAVAIPPIGSEAWDELNRRRGELIHKKNRQGLDDAEWVEFERLQAVVLEATETAFPRPPIDYETLERLERRLGAKQGSRRE